MASLDPRHAVLTPREAAELLGVHRETLATWAREGHISVAFITPGGHRRYTRQEIMRVRQGKPAQREPEEKKDIAEKMALLYQQGWTLRQLAEEFGISYGAVHSAIRKRTTMRQWGGPRQARQQSLFDQ